MSQIHIRPMSDAEITAALDQAARTDTEEGCPFSTLLRLVEGIEDADLVVEHPQLAIRLLAERQDRKAA